MKFFLQKSLFFYGLTAIFLLYFQLGYAQAEEIRIVALGDSITAGLMRDSDKVITCPHSNSDCHGRGVENRGGFVPFITSQIADIGLVARVFNWGYLGAESSHIMNRTSGALNRSNPRYVTLMIGANDATSNVSNTTLKFNVKAIAQNIISKGAIPILGTVTPDPRSINTQANIIKYNVAIREIADELDLLVADQYASMNEDFSTYESGDRKHFNDLGNERMAQEWVSALSTFIDPKKFSIAPILLLLFD